ncbi:NAD-dependent epimerase/dehydratase family protein [Algihabitans albus]|uniref:NAD-dependent epimerase/dehydratase family protein n=1 Tax=Algihabitans albus TaxID=2164067 RepID=UPI000E5C6A33|nr:NAD-dependent epimerase/dehydratase family protein [Algihabitans albus]
MSESTLQDSTSRDLRNRLSVDLVTGGHGFIGRHLVRQLQRGGRSVRILDLTEPADAIAPAVETIVGSVTDPTIVARAVQGVERVFHVAGDPNLWRADKAAFDRINHQGTRLVLDAAAAAGVRAFVHTSSAAILPFGRVSTLLPDDDADRLAPATMPGPYARSKLAAERAALAAARNGLPVTIVSPSLPIGADDRYLTPPMTMIRDLLYQRTPAYIDFDVSFIDVRDLARGLIYAAERGKPGHRYVLGHPPMSFSTFLERLEAISGVAMPRRVLPTGLALAAAWVSEFLADHITRRPPRASLEGVRMATPPIHLPFEDSARALGLDLRPLDESLRTAVAWLRASEEDQSRRRASQGAD